MATPTNYSVPLSVQALAALAVHDNINNISVIALRGEAGGRLQRPLTLLVPAKINYATIFLLRLLRLHRLLLPSLQRLRRLHFFLWPLFLLHIVLPFRITYLLRCLRPLFHRPPYQQRPQQSRIPPQLKR